MLSPNDVQILSYLDSFLEANPNLFINEDSEYIFNGKKVPRVTTMLSRGIHTDELMKWANYIGLVEHKKYNPKTNEDATIGTQTHDCIDYFFRNNTEVSSYSNLPIEVKQAYLSFSQWYRDINSLAKVQIVSNEHKMVSKYYGGTLDALMDIDGKLYLVDFKTSKNMYTSYTLQLAAYAILLDMLENIQLDGCILLQVSKTSIGYNEYVLTLDRPDHKMFFEECIHSFLRLVAWYYNFSYSERNCNNVFNWNNKRW